MSFYIIYLIAAIISSFFCNLYFKGRKKKFILFIIVFLPSIVSTFRNGIGTDYYVYYHHIEKYGSLGLLKYVDNNSFEIGHYIILRLSYIMNNEFILYFLYSFFTSLFAFFAISSKELESSNKLAWFVFLIYIYPSSFNIMKQSLAVSIILFSYVYIIRKDFRRFFLLVVLASLFHNSALIFLPCYFLPQFLKNKKQLIITLVVIIAVFAFSVFFKEIINKIVKVNIFNDYGSLLDNTRIKKSFSNYQKYISILMLVISVAFYGIIKNKSNFPLFIILIISIELSGVLIGDFSPYLKRISLYFTTFYPVALSHFKDCFKKGFSSTVAASLIIIFVIFCYFYNYLI